MYTYSNTFAVDNNYTYLILGTYTTAICFPYHKNKIKTNEKKIKTIS